MDLKFKKVEGFVEPQLVDSTSSPTVTYIHRNIERVTKTDPETGEEIQVWQFERATLSKAEYVMYCIEKGAGEKNLETELAVAELAEEIEQNKLDMELAIAELAESLV